MPTSGNYTRTGFFQMHSEALRYLGLRMQSGVPLVDADLNDFSDAIINYIRRITFAVGGDGHVNDGFAILESSPNVNDFDIQGGDGTDDGAGFLYISGLPGMLLNDVAYTSTTTIIHPQVSGISGGNLVLEDDSANYATNELAGRILTPDINNPGTTHTISSNTSNTITISSGDLSASTAAGNYYRVELSTPSGSNRTDEVYVDFFLDEIDSTEDTNLQHTIGNPAAPTDGAFRLGLRQLIKVSENGTTPSSPFTDSVGRRHYYQKIAELGRLDGNSAVTTAMISDFRPAITTQTGALNSIDGVSNPGGNVDLIGGQGITITPDDVNDEITISSSLDIPETFTCDAGVVTGDAVYMQSDGTLNRANATSSATMPAIGLVESKPTGTSCVVRQFGTLTGYSGLTQGDTVFVAATDGQVTTTAPTASGNVVQKLGKAATTTSVTLAMSLETVIKA